MFLSILTVSVVSHGHDKWLPGLLRQLAQTGANVIAHVIVTHNLPATDRLDQTFIRGLPFQVTERTNALPLGFGANHNRAFALVDTAYFCVLNPDITFFDSHLWGELLQSCQLPRTGCAFPVLRNSDGSVQDNARAVPTPLALFHRRLRGQNDARVDWASAALWVLPHRVFQDLRGFDEQYFMYCEDTDFCLRMQVKGWQLVQVKAYAVHHAQRSSHRSVRHLIWHLQSLLRLWVSPTLKAFRARSLGK